MEMHLKWGTSPTAILRAQHMGFNQVMIVYGIARHAISSREAMREMLLCVRLIRREISNNPNSCSEVCTK